MNDLSSPDETKPLVAVIGTRGYPSHYGGFETAVRHLAPYLVEAGWRVRVYGRPGQTSVKDSQIDSRVERITTWGIETCSLSTLSFGLFATLHALWKKPDVALVMNVANGYWLPLLKARGIPTVVNVDGIEWQRDKWSAIGKAIFKTGARMTARFASALICDARAIGDYWLENFRREGTFIPYGGTFVSHRETRSEFPPGSYLLAVARFVPENSIDLLLDSAPDLIANLDIDVVLVGSAPDSDPLQLRAKQVAQNPRVHLLGHIDDDERLFDLWLNSGVYFHGHTVGGTNPALVQAMALGASIVARDTPYNREVLGDAGRYCDNGAASLIQASRSALQCREDASSRAKARATNSYTWQNVCREYARILRENLE